VITFFFLDPLTLGDSKHICTSTCGPQVNSSPAVAEALLEPLVEDLVAVQVNRYFVGANKNEKETSGSSAGKGNAWELLFEGAKTHS